MKKILASLIVFGMMSMPVLALPDIDRDYWAAKEIDIVVKDKIMTLDNDGNFSPDKKVTRVEFVNSLLMLLSDRNLNTSVQDIFTDVTPSTPYYNNILRSEQLGLVSGYPDKTFKPNNFMTRSETQSIISHITANKEVDTAVLQQFSDYRNIPGWAVNPYAKSIQIGLYVNYPDANKLRPNDLLTRAEAAVLLANLRGKIIVRSKDYYGSEKVLATEHLDVSRKAENNEVKITATRKIILAGNALLVEFESAFKSQEHKAGDKVCFGVDEDLYTVEGTFMIPAGSTVEATVLDITDPKMFNKNARVYMQMTKVTFPDGKVTNICAKPFYKDYALKEGWWMNAGKVTLATLAGAAVGGGMGTGLAFIPTPHKIGTGLAIGIPVGAAVGLITGLVTPGLNYCAKECEEIYIILLEDAIIKK